MKIIFETIIEVSHLNLCIIIKCCTWQINHCFADAHNTFNLFDKKGDGRVSTKELEKVFKSLALQINDEQLKEWADEMDEEGMTLIKVLITLTCEISYVWFSSNICIMICAVFAL